ncbi:alpha and gamma adaptin binding protein p34 domain-containing protein [Neurospora intermedia]|uniref:Alpha and gamma adaptin binding protein p34 domain-containing protein n=1 Tax=Neurospora intermedia TaxID=5142 RepID=A0ABR3D2J1_NEUIN
MVSTKVEEIVNPRRILAVALTDSSDHLGAVIRDLTGTTPIPQQQQPPPSQEDEEDSSEPTSPEPSLAGITHHLPLFTPYYTASIPIWLDLISSPADWSATFLSEEAKEVLGVLGGVVCVFEIPSFTSTSGSSSSSSDNDDDAKVKAAQKEKTRELIKGVGKVVREGLGGWEWEGVGLAVGVTTTRTTTTTTAAAAASDIGGGGGETTTMEMDADMEDEINEWDDLCAEWGLEFVHHQVVVGSSSSSNNNKKREGKRNEYGEKMGIARVLEALQSNDWSGGDGDEGDNNNNNNNNRGLFDESENEEDYVDENEGDIEDEFDLGFGYTKKQKMEMRKAFLKGTEDSNRTAEEELEAFKSVMQTIEGQEKTMQKGEEKGESASVATDVAKAGPSAESGSGADKVKEEEEEEIGEEDVEKIAKMMLKLQAVRDMSGTVPEEQRRKLALKAVEEVMREL